MASVLLYDNMITASATTLTTSGSSGSTTGVINLASWQPGEVWTSSATNPWVKADAGSAVSADYLALFGHNLAVADVVTVYRSSDATTYTSVGTYTHDGRSIIYVPLKSASYRYWRVSFTSAAAVTLGLMLLGKKTSPPWGTPIGFEHPNFGTDTAPFGATSRDGSFIAMTTKPKPQNTTLKLELLSEAWMRSTWPALRDHVSKYPFLVVPNADHREEIFLAWLNSSEFPTPKYTDGKFLSVDIKVNTVNA